MEDMEIENITTVDFTDKEEDSTDYEAMAAKMSNDIASMDEKQEEKIEHALAHLKENLEITAEKYLTAGGVTAAYEEAAQFMEGVDAQEKLSLAMGVAIAMNEIALSMAAKVDELDADTIDTLCDGVYDPKFAMTPHSIQDTVVELMILNLCRNVGPNAEDIKNFKDTSDDEIEKAITKLEDFKLEHDLIE